MRGELGFCARAASSSRVKQTLNVTFMMGNVVTPAAEFLRFVR